MSEGQRTLILKFGGSTFSPPALAPFAERVRRLHHAGARVVIVHGGGKEINTWLERIGKTSAFIDGLRVTDDETLDVVEMVLSGRVNGAIVRALLAAGVPAVGLAGTDGATLVAEPLVVQKTVDGAATRVEYGHVGEVTHVETPLLQGLLADRYVVVLSPLAVTPKLGLLNVNADTAAARVAGALHADAFYLLTDVPGVLVPVPGGAQEVADELRASDVAGLKASGVVTGGMIPKVDACLEALSRGARAARIAGLEDFLSSDEPTGTRITEA